MVVIQGITGREASMVTNHALAYGTRILAGVPVYDIMKRACQKHDLNTAIVYVPPASAYDASAVHIGCTRHDECLPRMHQLYEIWGS